MYTMLADESRSSGAEDFFVFVGVIVRTDLLNELHRERAELAIKFTGRSDEEVKYSPDVEAHEEAALEVGSVEGLLA